MNSPILLIALKDLKELWRDKFGMFWVIGWPIIMAILFGVINSGMGKQQSGSISVGVINEDQSDYSHKFIVNLKKKDALYVLDYSLDSAENMVRRGKLAAYLRLKKGFGDTMGIFGEQKNLEIGMDPSRKAESGFLQGIIVQTVFETMQSRFSDKSMVKEQLQKGLGALDIDTTLVPNQKNILKNFMKDIDKFMTQADDITLKGGFFGGNGMNMELETKSVQRDYSGQPRSAFDITFPSAILWGMIGCTAAFAISIVSERRKGTYARLRMSPITSSQILLGKGTACFLACIADTILLLSLGILGFHVRVGNPFYLAMAAVSTAGCFVGIMMFVSVLGKTEQAVAGSGWSIFMICAMFGGGMVPLMFMPGWMQKVSNFSPVKWGVYSLEGAIWRDFSFQEMLFPCSVLIGIGIFLYLIGWSILQRKD